jgi:hypothetical protein
MEAPITMGINHKPAPELLVPYWIDALGSWWDAVSPKAALSSSIKAAHRPSSTCNSTRSPAQPRPATSAKRFNSVWLFR